MAAGRNARAVIARRRIKRAAGLLREAVQDLAALSDGADTIATVHVDDADSVGDAANVIRVAQSRYGDLDVVILARPSADAAPTTAGVAGEGDRSDGTSQDTRDG